MVSPAYKNRTRDEVVAPFRESIRKKNEWIKQTDEEFKRIREERIISARRAMGSKLFAAVCLSAGSTLAQAAMSMSWRLPKFQTERP